MPDLSHFHFLRPWWLLSLVPAIALFVYVRRGFDSARSWRGVVADHLLPHLLSGGEEQRRVQPIHWLLAAWFIAAIAVAGPAWQREPSPFASDEAALVVVLQVTPTMLAQDIQPSRLERAAQKIGDLLARRPGTRTALVAYAGSAHLAMPLTHDAGLITQFASQLDPKIMPAEGNATADALALADDQLRRSGLRGSILLVTDSIGAEQLPKLTTRRGAPVQILAMAGPPGTPLPPDSPPAPAYDRTAMERAADELDASVTLVTPDPADVDSLARHTVTRVVAAESDTGGERWRDAGYWLGYALAALTLLWFRPGWVIPGGD